MQKLVFTTATFFTFVFLFAPVLALNVTVSVDKKVVSPGENFTISGTIASDAGVAGVYTYRAAAVGPNRTFICDSGRQQTASDGIFSLTCTAPTREEAVALGIHNADRRAVIPLRAGVAVNDSVENEIVRARGTVHVVLKEDLDTKLRDLVRNIDNFVERAGRFSERCENIPTVVQQVANINVRETCAKLRQIAEEQTDKANSLRERSQAIISENASSENVELLKERVQDFRGNFRRYTGEIDQAKRIVSDVRGRIPAMSRGAGR